MFCQYEAGSRKKKEAHVALTQDARVAQKTAPRRLKIPRSTSSSFPGLCWRRRCALCCSQLLLMLCLKTAHALPSATSRRYLSPYVPSALYLILCLSCSCYASRPLPSAMYFTLVLSILPSAFCKQQTLPCLSYCASHALPLILCILLPPALPLVFCSADFALSLIYCTSQRLLSIRCSLLLSSAS